VPAVSAAALPGTITTFSPCVGEDQVTVNPAFIRVSRTGSTADALVVDVTYGGSLGAGVDYPALPDPVTIDAGSGFAISPVRATRGGTVTISIEPGAGYTATAPLTVEATITESRIAASCAAPDEQVQTIEVGQTPVALPVNDTYGGALADATLGIVGDVPPGLSFAADGTWTGRATTVGTFTFTARYCLGTDTCVVEIPVTIVVVAPRAVAAEAITGGPRYTG
jgi:hypothetical protein